MTRLRRHLADILAALLIAVLCWGLVRHAQRESERQRIQWREGVPYCPDGSIAGADEQRAAQGNWDVAVCSDE